MEVQPADPRTFRATVTAWLGQLTLPVVFFGLLMVTCARAGALSPLVAAICLGVISFFAVRDYLLPMARDWLRVDRLKIEGNINDQWFEMYWTEILAAWIFEHRRRRFLCLGTREGSYMISLRFFDQAAVWACVRASVPPTALREDAIHRVPDYQDWMWRREQVLQSATPYVVTDHWLVQIVAWASLLCFVLGAVGALQSRLNLLAGGFILLAVLSVRALLAWGVTEFSAEAVRRHTLLGGWTLRWEQVERIELDPLDSVLVLVTDDCQKVLPGPGVWSGSRREALSLLLAQVEQHGIPMRRSPLAALKFSRRIRSRR